MDHGQWTKDRRADHFYFPDHPTAPYIPPAHRPGAPMIRLILLCAFLLLVLLIAGPIIAAHFLPWWGTLLLVVAELAFLVFAVPKLIKWGFKGVLMGIF